MRLLLPALAATASLLSVAPARAVSDGKVSVTRNGELDGFTQKGKLHRLGSLKAFIRFTHQAQNRSILKRCGLQRALLEDLKGPPGTDGLSSALRFRTRAGARRCAHKSAPTGKKVSGLPHSKLVLVGEGDHPGRNLTFRVGRTFYTVAFSPTPSFDPGNRGLITAGKALYARVR